MVKYSSLGGMAQLVEHSLHMRGVTGSSPVVSTKKRTQSTCVLFFVKILVIAIPTKRLTFGKRLRYKYCIIFKPIMSFTFFFLFLLALGVIYCAFCAINNDFPITINRKFVIYIGHNVAVYFFCIVNIIIYFNRNPCIIIFFCM